MTTNPPHSHSKAEFPRALRAELHKLVSLPAIWLTIASSEAVCLVLTLAFVHAGNQGSTGAASCLDIGLAPLGYTQAGFLVLGIIATTSEHFGGQLNSTLLAMPRRSNLHLAKTVALFTITLPIAATVTTSGVFLAQLTLGKVDGSVAPSGIASTVAGAACYLTLTSLLAFAVAGLFRRVLPSVISLLGYYFIVGPLVRDQTSLAKYLPDTAGYTMWFPSGAGDSALEPAAGWALVIAWTGLFVGVSAATFQRRDA